MTDTLFDTPDTPDTSRGGSGMTGMRVSERGLRLIKAFEGFRPVDRMLVTGTRVVGHGHRLTDDRAVMMTREQAHETLLDDLAPFEDMVAETVFAPLTQSQFDALVSLAFNIGPRAFLDSDVLRALSAGRILDAAAGFDVWRQADVAGQTFVIDALVRRRTAEKALFLRPSEDMMVPRASTADMSPKRDMTLDTSMRAPALDRDEAGRLVADAPYEMSRLIVTAPGRRRDDGPSGEMALTELDDPDEGFTGRDTAQTIYSGLDSVLGAPLGPDVDQDDLFADDTPFDSPARDVTSPIAAAAEDVRDRLDALMESPMAGADSREADRQTDGQIDGQIDRERFETIEEMITSSDDAILDLDADVEIGDTVESGLFGPVTEPASPANDEDVVVPFPTPARPATFRAMPSDVPGDMDTRATAVPGSERAPTIDSLAQDAALRDRGAIGEMTDTDWSPSTVAEPRATSAWPFIALFMLGGALFGAGAILLNRGVGMILGQPRELVGLGAAMVGAMIILGALFYLLKTTIDGDRS